MKPLSDEPSVVISVRFTGKQARWVRTRPEGNSAYVRALVEGDMEPDYRGRTIKADVSAPMTVIDANWERDGGFVAVGNTVRIGEEEMVVTPVDYEALTDRLEDREAGIPEAQSTANVPEHQHTWEQHSWGTRCTECGSRR